MCLELCTTNITLRIRMLLILSIKRYPLWKLLYAIIYIYYLQLGRHPVAGVITCYISTDYEDFPLNSGREGYMGSK